MQNGPFASLVSGSILAALIAAPLAAIQADDIATEPTVVVHLNSHEAPGFILQKSGALENQGQAIQPKCEGEGAGPANFSVVNDPTSGGRRVIHYLVTTQKDGHKARMEHYLHIAPMNSTYISEFSIKLDPDFTVVKSKRPDGGPNWCCLHQWHQCAPESPPLALAITAETNNVVHWDILHGDCKGHDKHEIFGEKTIQLNHWYNFRVKWNVSPDKDGLCVVMMSDSRLPKDLDDSDILFRYAGPIGYTLKSKPPAVAAEGNHHGPLTVREQQGIYQGAHEAPNSHHGYSIDNLAIYKLGNF
jgi:hypothetical protein